MKTLTTHSPDETQQVAASIAGKLKKGDILALVGDLGAGKTCFVQGLAKGLHVSEKCYVSSPTFTILKVYPGDIDIYHFDFYRLSEPGEFEDLGFDDYLKGEGICVIEWADRFIDLLPRNLHKIEFEIVGENERKIIVPNEIPNHN